MNDSPDQSMRDAICVISHARVLAGLLPHGESPCPRITCTVRVDIGECGVTEKALEQTIREMLPGALEPVVRHTPSGAVTFESRLGRGELWVIAEVEDE